MAQRAGCKTSTIASSHASLIAHAREVADLILTAAQESIKEQVHVLPSFEE